MTRIYFESESKTKQRTESGEDLIELACRYGQSIVNVIDKIPAAGPDSEKKNSAGLSFWWVVCAGRGRINRARAEIKTAVASSRAMSHKSFLGPSTSFDEFEARKTINPSTR